jgi:hypothetical protein
MQKPEIQSIDHIVMQAADLAATIKFYTEILGMEHSSFQPPTGGPVRQSLHLTPHRRLFHMPKTRLLAVLIYVSSQRSRLPIGKRILPIMALILKMDRFAKPAQTARFCQFIFVTPTII